MADNRCTCCDKAETNTTESTCPSDCFSRSPSRLFILLVLHCSPLLHHQRRVDGLSSLAFCLNDGPSSTLFTAARMSSGVALSPSSAISAPSSCARLDSSGAQLLCRICH